MPRVVMVLAFCLAACGGDQGPEPMGPDPATIGKDPGAGSTTTTTTTTPPDTSGTTAAKPPAAKPPAAKPPAAKPPAAKPAELTAARADTLLGRFVVLLELAATQLVAAKGDCPTIAKVLNGWVDKNAAEAKTIYLQLGAAQKHTEVMKKHGPKLAQTQAVFGKATAPCAKDPAVEKAARRFILSLQGKPTK